MRFTPRYMVSYKGSFYRAGKPFDIDPADADEMIKHGYLDGGGNNTVIDSITADIDSRQYKRPGRPRKNQQ